MVLRKPKPPPSRGNHATQARSSLPVKMAKVMGAVSMRTSSNSKSVPRHQRGGVASYQNKNSNEENIIVWPDDDSEVEIDDKVTNEKDNEEDSEDGNGYEDEDEDEEEIGEEESEEDDEVFNGPPPPRSAQHEHSHTIIVDVPDSRGTTFTAKKIFRYVNIPRKISSSASSPSAGTVSTRENHSPTNDGSAFRALARAQAELNRRDNEKRQRGSSPEHRRVRARQASPVRSLSLKSNSGVEDNGDEKSGGGKFGNEDSGEPVTNSSPRDKGLESGLIYDKNETLRLENKHLQRWKSEALEQPRNEREDHDSENAKHKATTEKLEKEKVDRESHLNTTLGFLGTELSKNEALTDQLETEKRMAAQHSQALMIAANELREARLEIAALKLQQGPAQDIAQLHTYKLITHYDGPPHGPIGLVEVYNCLHGRKLFTLSPLHPRNDMAIVPAKIERGSPCPKCAKLSPEELRQRHKENAELIAKENERLGK